MMLLNKLILLLSLAAMFVLPQPCHAGQATILNQHKLAAVFEEVLLNDSPFTPEDLEISNFSCYPDQVKLPPGRIEYLPDLGNMAGKLGRRIVNLTITVNGAKEAEIKMAGDLTLFGDVLVAVRNLKRGTIITEDDFKITRGNITMLGPDLVTESHAAIGKQLKTTLRPGAVFFNSQLKNPQIVRRGDRVIITAENGRIHISVPGQARAAGAVGDMIKVKNLMSRREIYARIINEDEVAVEF